MVILSTRRTADIVPFHVKIVLEIFLDLVSCSVVFDSLCPHRLCSLPGSSVRGIFQAKLSE